MTITIMKTTKGGVCGGYLDIAWEDSEVGFDQYAFLFSLNHRLKLTPSNADLAVIFNLGNGIGP